MNETLEKNYIYYDQTMKACEYVKQLIISNDLVLYGGMAINFSLLEKGDKIYQDWEMPDYDFYSNENVKHTRELFKILIKAGFSRVDCMSAIHPGTMKTRVGIEMVSDATLVHENVLKFQRKYAGKFDGVLYRNPYLQMADMHKVLSLPTEDFPSPNVTNRWEKDFGRLMKLMKHYKAKDFDAGPDVKEKGIKFKKRENVLYCGDVSFNYYRKKMGLSERPVRFVTYICDDKTFGKFEAEAMEEVTIGNELKRNGDIELVFPKKELLTKNGHCNISYLIMYYYLQHMNNLKNNIKTDSLHRYKELLEIVEVVYPNLEKYPDFIPSLDETYGENLPNRFEMMKLEDPNAAKELVPTSISFNIKYNNPKDFL